jgi:hypothetical protein
MPLGWAPLSWRPISMLVDTTLPSSVAVPANSRVVNYTLEMYPSGGTPIYAAVLPFITLSTDALPNTLFEGRLDKALQFNRSIVGGSTIGGAVSAGYGELELINSDARYDTIYQNNTIDGRRIVVKYGQIDPATDIPATYDTYPSLLDGMAEDWHLDDATLRISIRDNGFKLDVPASPNTYGGTGGADGTADMAGKRKPLAFGVVNNITPAQVNPANLTYQAHDGSVTAFVTVYDSGYALVGPDIDYPSYAALAASTVGNGHFNTCKAQGLFRIGSAPNGAVTCDIQGDNGGSGGWVLTTAAIARRIISVAATQVDLVDEGTFATLAAGQPATIGYFLGLDENKTVRQALDELMLGIGGWVGFRRDGTLECGRFIAPTGTALDTFTTADIVDGSLKKLELPSGINPPPKRVRVGYSRIWTVQTDGIVGGVSDTRKQILKSPFSVATHSNTSLATTISSSHLLAQDPDPISAYFDASADAITEADRLLSLWGAATRAIYSFTDKSGRALSRKIGDVITLTYPRFDLAAGKLCVVVGENTDTTQGTVELTVFG